VTSGSDRRRLFGGAQAVVCWLALATPSWAQAQASPKQYSATDEARAEGDSHTRTAARTLAAEGAAAFERRDFPAALDLFTRAGALIEAPTIVLMQARTLVELGRWVEAADRYSFAMNLQSPDSANPAFQAALQAAADEHEALKARLPLLKIELEGGRSAEVWVDGRLLPAPLVGVDTPLDPGKHRVEAREPGRAAIVREITLREGAREQLLIPLREDPEPEVANAPAPHLEPTSTPVSATDSTSNDTLGWVALGTGAGATLVGIGTGLYALNKKSDLDAACKPGCPPSFEDDIDSFRQFRTVSYVAFGVGALGLGWGSYVLLSGKPDSPTVAVRASTRGAWVEGSF